MDPVYDQMFEELRQLRRPSCIPPAPWREPSDLIARAPYGLTDLGQGIRSAALTIGGEVVECGGLNKWVKLVEPTPQD